jgi:hypothetical protein
MARKLKIFLTIVGSIVITWFWGNAALQFVFYHVMASDAYIRAELDRVPEKLKISESNIEDEYLNLYGYKFKIPTLKTEKIVEISHYLFAKRLSSISLFIKDNDKTFDYMSLDEIPVWYSPVVEESLFYRLEHWLFYEDVPFWELEERTNYARLSDLSLWNLAGNLKLYQYLTLRILSIPSTSKNFKRYEVETPHVRGFLTEIYHENRLRPFSYFSFMLNNRNYSITLSSRSEKNYDLREIIGTIRKIENIEESYDETEALYKNNPGYPKELLILSLISLKGPQENYQREYLIEELRKNLERHKEDYKKAENDEERQSDKEWIEEIQADIEYFQNSME